MDCGTCTDPIADVGLTIPTQDSVIEASVSLSDKGRAMLLEAFGDEIADHALLVGVESGGCSGYMYDLQIVTESTQACQELVLDGIRVLIPNAVSHLLDGIEIDYVDRLMGGGFKINNPNANRSCGCGESFS